MSLSFEPISEDQWKDLSSWDCVCFPEESWTEKMLRTHLEFHAGFVLKDVDTKGYVLICETPWEVEIFRIATMPTYRKSGVAKTIFSHLFKIFPNKDFFLEVKEQNEPAILLYKSVGFEILELRKNYYPNGSNAILMKRKREE